MLPVPQPVPQPYPEYRRRQAATQGCNQYIIDLVNHAAVLIAKSCKPVLELCLAL